MDKKYGKSRGAFDGLPYLVELRPVQCIDVDRLEHSSTALSLVPRLQRHYDLSDFMSLGIRRLQVWNPDPDNDQPYSFLMMYCAEN